VKRNGLASRLLTTFLGELEEQVGVMNQELLALEGAPDQRDRLHAVFRIAHTLKGAARAAGVPLVERVCHALESVLADARDGKRTLGAPEFALLFGAADALGDAGARLKAGAELADSPLSTLDQTLRGETAPATRTPPRGRGAGTGPAPSRNGQVRVDAAKLDALLASGTELLVAAGRPRVRVAELDVLRDRAARCAARWRLAGRRLRVALDRAGAPAAAGRELASLDDELQRLAGDAGRVTAAARADARTITRVVDDVLDHAQRLRMRPFAEASEALPRAVRDLSQTAGKDVELRVEGAGVEVDRLVLDGLREALLQLVRNAVDHGVETPAERAAAGKPRQAALRVAAALRGDRLAVSVADDGRGLDLAAIRSALERRGIPVPADERDVARALLEARLTTREEATAVSGRGVGLDIVRAAVERMGGHVAVTWIPNGGTTFVLDCPITLASVHALLVVAGSQIVALPLAHVERLHRARSGDLRLVEGRHVLPTTDGPVPVVALAGLLPPLPEHLVSDAPMLIVLLRAGARRLAAVVDELLETRELAVRPIRGVDPQLPLVRGAALLETGRIALVVDPVALVAVGLRADVGPGLSVAEPRPAGPVRRRILVVDDSITTRTLESSILEAAGYDVLTAVDGSDGWRVLQEQGCDLVVADIEMPRMDGFALCEAIRASRRFGTLPIVLVTALERPEDRARGLEVGADAYIGKSSFDQENLLDAVRQLLD